ATRSSSSSKSSRVTRPSWRATPARPSPARSPRRVASPRQRLTESSRSWRAPSRRMPPRSLSSPASSSRRSAVRATTPTAARASRSTRSRSDLPRSAMRPAAAALTPTLALRLRLRDGPVAAAGNGRLAGDRRDHVERRLRRRLGRQGRLRARPGHLQAADASAHLLAPDQAPVLRLPLLPDREQRRRDEDRGVGAGGDPDDQSQRERPQRVAAEEVER